MKARLYPTLDNLLAFLSSLDDLDISDGGERKRAAVARYIAELPATPFFALRVDWRKAVASL